MTVKTLKRFLGTLPKEMEVGLARDAEMNSVRKVLEMALLDTDEGKRIIVLVPSDGDPYGTENTSTVTYFDIVG